MSWTNQTKNSSRSIDQSQTEEDDKFDFGRPSGVSTVNIAQTFTPSVTSPLYSIKFDLSKIGSPSDTVQLLIYTDGSGSPGTLLSTSTNSISGSTLLTGFNPTSCEFLFTGLTLTANTIYWAVLNRTGSTDNTNFYQAYVGYGASDLYTRGKEYYKTTIWNLADGGGTFYDLVFSEYGDFVNQQKHTSTYTNQTKH